jgi:hypothetical protein
MVDSIIKNQRFISLLPFETMVIMAHCFFRHINVKKIKLKIHFIQF